MNDKKYVHIFVLTVGIFFLANVVLWNFFVRETFIDKDGHGDLDRLGGYFSGYAATKQISYNKKHIDFQDYIINQRTDTVAVLTIGDSFSNGGGGCFYQDYLADKYDKNVLHVMNNTSFNAVQLLYLMDKFGYLDTIQPQTVILESVERYMNDRFGEADILIPDITKEEFERLLFKKEGNTSGEANDKIAPGIMMNANRKFIQNKMMYYKASADNTIISSDVLTTHLDTPLFSTPGNENLLMYYHADLWYEKIKPAYDNINDNINKVADFLHSKNIKLVFMTNVDKYDLYYPYVLNKEIHSENNFFEEFESLPKSYAFVNTKQILRKLLADGTKDVYWLNDTHWSWKGQQAVVDAMMKDIGL